MLLWEQLNAPTNDIKVETESGSRTLLHTRRLPYDNQCAAVTKAGRRCRGRIRKGQDFCPFHDPTIDAQRRRRNAARNGRGHHRLTHIPGGYLRRLTSRRGVGEAMDRLYRELRLGIVTPEMASVLFNIITRLFDSGLCDAEEGTVRRSGRSRAERLRPHIREALTRAERAAWRQAVTNAPAAFLRNGATAQAPAPADTGKPKRKRQKSAAHKPALSAAS